VDATVRLQWERTLLQELSRSEVFPNVHHEWVLGNHYFVTLTDMGEKTLRHHLRENGALDTPTVLNIGLQLCSGVKQAHQRNIILRDLSLENVLWDGEKIAIIDLEYAYRPDGPPLDHIGTPGFSLMRQMDVRYKPLNPNPSHDIYSIGAILYTLLSPKSYLEFLDLIQTSYNERNLHKAWERSALPDEVPSRLAEVLERCLSPDHRRRYRKIDTLERDLQNLRRR
jgi:serine/threonine protein kinase